MTEHNRSPGGDQDLRNRKANQRKLRKTRLRHWAETVQRVVLFDIAQTGWPGHHDLPVLYARIKIERCQLEGTLGFDDEADIAEVAELFCLSSSDIVGVWNEAKDEALANEEELRAAADRRLTETGVATLGHRPLVDAPRLSAALRLSKTRKQMIFPVPRSLVDGRLVVGKRYKTMLPTWVPPMPRLVAPSSEATETTGWTLTLTERRHLRERLGYRLSTISRKQRELTESEFRTWAAKREAQTWSTEALDGRKLEGESDYHATLRLQKIGPKTRSRKMGVTEARRAYAKAIGKCERTARTRTMGMSVEEILALTEAENVTRLPRYESHSCPDKNREKALFRAKTSGISVVTSDPGNGTEKGENRDKDLILNPHDMAGLEDWYLGKKGKPLKPATIRKWRQRGMVARMLFSACEYVERNSTSFGPRTVMNALMRMREFQDARSEKEHRDRLENLPLRGKLIRLVG